MGLPPRQPLPEALTNEQLALWLTEEAKAAAARRRALLVAAAALAGTTTITGARRALGEYDGPPVLVAAALAVLDDLPERCARGEPDEGNSGGTNGGTSG